MRTKGITFGVFDTEQLKKALEILNEVYEYNYDSSRKERLLATVIRKLGSLITEYGEDV